MCFVIMWNVFVLNEEGDPQVTSPIPKFLAKPGSVFQSGDEDEVKESKDEFKHHVCKWRKRVLPFRSTGIWKPGGL